MEKDISGNKYGRLTAIKRDGFTSDGRPAWLFRCECGKVVRKSIGRVMTGRTKSCGCLRKDAATAFCKSRAKHGMRNTRIYREWRGMKDRCSVKNWRQYDSYYGKGVRICEEWENNFSAFYDWAIKNGYNDSLTLDRINNDGNYEPSNCRWATYEEQNNNKSNTIRITYNGQTKSLKDWGKTFGIDLSVLHARYYRGDAPDKLFRSVRKEQNQ